MLRANSLQKPLLRKPVAGQTKHKIKNKAFEQNLQRAIRIGVAVAIFGLPIYSAPVHDFVFGQTRTVKVDGKVQPVCSRSDLFWRVNVARRGAAPRTEKHNEEFHGAWDQSDPRFVWCGVLPKMYEKFWPNVVVRILITSAKSTGDTVMNAWQGMIGTFCATLNLALMIYIFPSGARGHVCTDVESVRGLCDAGSFVHDDPGYSDRLCWFDTLLVALIFLLGNTSVNCIKLGLAMHLGFMMNFMNPNIGAAPGVLVSPIPWVEWDSEPTAVFLTSLVGVSLAVLVTLVPEPLTNFPQLFQDAKKISSAERRVWEASIAYYCGGRRTGTRDQIGLKIQTLGRMVSGARGRIAASWWETFDMGNAANKRSLYSILDFTIEQMLDALNSVMYCVSVQTFDEKHNRACEMTKESMSSLQDEASNLLSLCVAVCDDGVITKEESRDLQKLVDIVNKKQAELLVDFRKAVPDFSPDYAEEYMFFFALSTWARRTTDLASGVGQLAAAHGATAVRPFRALKDGFQSTWSISAISSPDHLSFALRNFLSIAITFVLGYFLEGGVFTRYSATMSVTLVLLTSKFKGSAFQNNLRRLLGVALGKVVPILIMAIVMFCPSGTFLRSFMHMTLLIVYIVSFQYMFIASLQWAAVGMAMSMFGCATLLTVSYSSPRDTFAARYIEIAQVTVAIVVQMLVDTVFAGASPRDIAIKRLEALLSSLTIGYKALFEGNIDMFEQCLYKGQAQALLCEEIIPECDPKLEVVPGERTPFKLSLYTNAVAEIRHLLSGMKAALLATKQWTAMGNVKRVLFAESVKALAKEEVMRPLQMTKSWKIMRDDFLDTQEKSAKSLIAILSHDSETPILNQDVADLENTSGLSKLDGLNEVYDQLKASFARPNDAQAVCDLHRAEAATVCVTLGQSLRQIANISHHCLRENIH